MNWEWLVGLAFWVQRPRYWTLKRQLRIMQGEELFASPPPESLLEQGWRRQRFRVHQPSPWELWILKHEARRRGRPAAGDKPGRRDKPAPIPPKLLPPLAAGADRLIDRLLGSAPLAGLEG